MTVIQSSRSASAFISHFDTEVHYAKTNSAGAAPTRTELFLRDQDTLDTQKVTVHDVRNTDQNFSVPKSGFQYYRWSSIPEGIDYTNNEEVTERYLPGLEQIIKEELGASSVKAFSHKIRNTIPNLNIKNDRTYAGPAERPHVDFTNSFAPVMLKYKGKEQYKDVVENNKKWMIINAWKPLKTVQRDPLIIADPTSVSPEDFIVVEQPEMGPGVEAYYMRKPAKVGSEYTWWYMDKQTSEEVLLFVQFDSEGSVPVAHTAVSLPGAVAEEARESIEVRLFVVF